LVIRVDNQAFAKNLIQIFLFTSRHRVLCTGLAESLCQKAQRAYIFVVTPKKIPAGPACCGAGIFIVIVSKNQSLTNFDRLLVYNLFRDRRRCFTFAVILGEFDGLKGLMVRKV